MAPEEEPLPASVVIASRERPQMLLETVDSVLAGGRVPRELVVADQSAMAHPELARRGEVRGCEVLYVQTASAGLSAARNVGIEHSSQEVVVILDDDMLVQEDSLELLLAGRHDGEARVVTTGRLLAAPAEGPGLTQPPGALVTRTEPEVFRGRQPRQVVPGPNISVPRAVFAEIGGYDERLGAGTHFPAGEDHDLSMRLLDAGCEVRHVPGSVVLHRSWRARRDVVKLRWGYARGVGGFYAKHLSLRDRHTLQRATREARTRLSRALSSLRRAPRVTVREAVTIAGIAVGIVEWFVRYRRPDAA